MFFAQIRNSVTRIFFWLTRDRQRLLFAYSLSFFLIFISTCLYYLVYKRHIVPPSFFHVVKMILWPFCEWACFFLLGYWLFALAEKKRFWFFVFGFCYWLFTIVCAAQFSAIVESSRLIEALALENIAQAHLVRGSGKYIRFGVLIGMALLFFVGIIKRPSFSQSIRKPFLAICTVFCIAIVSLQNIYFDEDHAFDISLLQKDTPFVAFAKSVNKAFVGVGESIEVPVGVDFRGIFHFNKRAAYPFVKDTVYQNNFPFAKNAQESLGYKPNIIVFFLEGMSARTINCYSSEYNGLTDNYDAFCNNKNTMKVDNYYNHTFATFRGLHGQMASCFPRRGGGGGWVVAGNAEKLKHRSYSTIPRILQKHGYTTLFFSPHPRSNALTDMLEMLGFDEIFTKERSSAALGLDTQHQSVFYDSQLIDSLIAHLKKGEGAKAETPFYLGLYPIETHAFMDTTPDGVKYGDGTNRSLNTIHNSDVQFAKFFEYFKNSPYAKNTILIVTADHAHYPEPPFVAIAKQPYQPVTFDRIPFLIYSEFMDLPKDFDAQGRTSLAFAPTLLHFLGIQKEKNSFLGRSLFDPKRFSFDMGMGHITENIVYYNDTMYGTKDKRPRALRSDIRLFLQYVSLFYKYEDRNKVFPPAE